jgi:hypothetical protein
MASFLYNEWKKNVLAAWIAGADLRFALVMAGSTAATANDGKAFVGDLGTALDLKESDATGYARVAATGEAVAKDDTNDRGVLKCNTISFANMTTAADADYIGVLAYDHVTNDANSPIVGFFEFSNGPLSKNATQIDIPIDADEGIIRIN